MRRVVLLFLFVFSGCADEPLAAVNEPAQPTVEIEGKTLALELERIPLLSPAFAHYTTGPDGIMKVAESRPRACYYIAQLVADTGSIVGRAAMENCDGPWSGVAFVGSKAFDVSESGAELVAAPCEMRPGVCGVDSESEFAPVEVVVPDNVRRQALEATHYVELIVFRDAAMLDRADEGPDPVSAVHIAAALYDGTPFTTRILPVIVAAFDSPDDPWGRPRIILGRAQAGNLRTKFNDWLEDEAASLPRFDQATLLSGYNFIGSTVGITNVSGACKAKGSGAIVKGAGSNAAVGQTLAHELGHSLGMNHDGSGNSCDSDPYVMTSVYSASGPFPTEFSTCSVLDGNAFLASEEGSCVDAESSGAAPEAFCGDGLVEGDEACDCGPDGCVGRDECCVEATCQLTPECMEPVEPDPSCPTGEQDGDQDGVIDCLDACPSDADKTEPGDCGCGSLEDCAANNAANNNGVGGANNGTGSGAPDDPSDAAPGSSSEGCSSMPKSPPSLWFVLCLSAFALCIRRDSGAV